MIRPQIAETSPRVRIIAPVGDSGRRVGRGDGDPDHLVLGGFVGRVHFLGLLRRKRFFGVTALASSREM
jgi:hypothetical protein